MQGTSHTLWYPDVFLWHSLCSSFPYRTLLSGMVERFVVCGRAWSRWRVESLGGEVSYRDSCNCRNTKPRLWATNQVFCMLKWMTEPLSISSCSFPLPSLAIHNRAIRNISGSWNFIAVSSSAVTKNLSWLALFPAYNDPFLQDLY